VVELTGAVISGSTLTECVSCTILMECMFGTWFYLSLSNDCNRNSNPLPLILLLYFLSLPNLLELWLTCDSIWFNDYNIK